MEARKCLEVQRDFLNEHLGKWVPKLSADILKSARREFYKAIAKITEGYVEMDKKLVEELLDSLAADSDSHRIISMNRLSFCSTDSRIGASRPKQ